MAKRGNLEGNIRKRPDGRWEGRIMLPDGTRKSIYGPSQENVIDRITEFRVKIKSEMPVTTATETTQILCEAYLVHMANMGTKYQTVNVYRSKLRTHIYPVVGDVPLSHVKTGDVQKIIDRMIAGRRQASTIRTTIALFKSVFGWVSKTFLLPSDPFLSITIPKQRSAVMQFVQPNEIKKFLSIPMAPTIKIATVIALKTGLRRGEVLGLKWDDINWDLKQLRVVRSMAPRTQKKKTPGPTKNKASEGTVILSDDLIADLKEYRALQGSLGHNYTSKGFIVATKNGDPIEPNYLSDQYNKAVKKHWPSHIRFHDLRHSHATYLVSVGVGNSIIKERLRWSSSRMIDRYVHVTDQMQRDAVDKLSILFQ